MMDAEPGRCRRTDGKKWRCRRSVVADQKYCERHMHRGRQRSRKLVEDSENVLRSYHPIVNMSSSLPSVSSTNTTNSNNKINVSTPIGSQPSYTVSNTSKSAPSAVYITSASPTSEKKASNDNIVNLSATSATIICCNSKNEGSCKFKVDMYNTKSSSTASSSIKAACTNNMIGSRSKYIKGKVVDFNNNKVRVISCSNRGREGCLAKFCGPVYGLSPKSVLQGVTDARCSLLSSNHKNVTETEPQRCRRTDGKKWRCSRSVVHGQKYCETHMHRGVKKVAAVPNLTAIDSAAPSTSRDSNFFVARRINSRINLNIDPSTSIAACPLPMTEDDSTTSSSSDATTITD